MLIKHPSDVRSSEISDKATYLNRRAFIQAAVGALGVGALFGAEVVHAQQPAARGRRLEHIQKSPLSTTETPNTWQQITTYNNFYEFGIDKKDAATYSKTPADRRRGRSRWKARSPEPAVWHLEDVLKGRTLEERIYRHRCVEGWSMVIPWVGFPLRDLIAQAAADLESPVRRVHDVERPEADARDPRLVSSLAVHRRSADGRSDASAHDSRGRLVR